MSKQTLVIVESPSKAVAIQKYLGNDYKVLASYGHIRDLLSGGKNGIGIDIGNKFKPKYGILKDKINIIENLISETEKSDFVILAADFDREGSAVNWHIQNVLESSGKTFKCITFNEITKKAILDAIQKPGNIDINMVRSQEARRILDRIVGFLTSPFLIQYFGNNLSAGRVQSIGVKLVVEREQEIENFIPKEYWNLYLKFKNKNNEEFITKYENDLVNNDEVNIISNLISQKDDWIVSKVKAQSKKEKPAAPFTTAKLQQTAARKLNFSTEHTMQIAQSLYESGRISYHRTDSTAISEDALKMARSWLKDNKFDIPKSPNIYIPKETAQQAHTSINPTDLTFSPDDKSLSADEEQLYTLIYKQFLASQMCSAVFDTLSVQIASASNPKLSFKASGKALKYKGYLEILGNIEDTKIEIPNLSPKEQLSIGQKSLKTEQKYTQPLPRYNEATINEQLEHLQIGRPSTYAEIIKKITSRNYVEKKGQTYRPTELGKKITNILIKYFDFLKYDYTAELEKKLDLIADGKLNYIDMLNEFYSNFKKSLDQAYIDAGSPLCEKCGNIMVIKLNKEKQKFYGCSAYPKCYSAKPLKENENNSLTPDAA